MPCSCGTDISIAGFFCSGPDFSEAKFIDEGCAPAFEDGVEHALHWWRHPLETELTEECQHLSHHLPLCKRQIVPQPVKLNVLEPVLLNQLDGVPCFSALQ